VTVSPVAAGEVSRERRHQNELRSDSLEWDWPNPSCTSLCCGLSETNVAGINGAVTLRLLVDMQTHQARSPRQPSVLPMQTSGSLLLAARKIGQNVRTALHLGGCGIGDYHIEMIFNLEEQRQFIQRIEPQIF
jgi:hypothetical protein